MKLTKRQREVLQTMVDNEDEAEGELVCSKPGGWWLGDTQVGGKTAFFLLRHILIRQSCFESGLEVYVASEYTKKALTIPDWEISQEYWK